MPGRRLDWERSVPTPRKRWGLNGREGSHRLPRLIALRTDRNSSPKLRGSEAN